MIYEKIVKVQQIKEVPVEVIKIQEIIKEVEKIVYMDSKGKGGKVLSINSNF